MDFIKGALDGDNNANQNNNNNNNNQQGSSSGEQNQGGNNNNNSGGGGGFLSSIGDKINGAAGGGKESEKNEDYLDKGVDFVQEKFLGGGAQDNESAVEQAKDEQISDFIRGKYKSTTGSDVPIQDKATSLDRNVD